MIFGRLIIACLKQAPSRYFQLNHWQASSSPAHNICSISIQTILTSTSFTNSSNVSSTISFAYQLNQIMVIIIIIIMLKRAHLARWKKTSLGTWKNSMMSPWFGNCSPVNDLTQINVANTQSTKPSYHHRLSLAKLFVFVQSFLSTSHLHLGQLERTTINNEPANAPQNLSLYGIVNSTNSPPYLRAVVNQMIRFRIIIIYLPNFKPLPTCGYKSPLNTWRTWIPPLENRFFDGQLIALWNKQTNKRLARQYRLTLRCSCDKFCRRNSNQNNHWHSTATNWPL